MNDIFGKGNELNDVAKLINEYRTQSYQHPLKDSSIKQYIQNWNRLIEQFKNKWSEDTNILPHMWFSETDKVISMINDMRDKRYPDKIVTIPMRRNYISALIQMGQVFNINPEYIKAYTDARSQMNKEIMGEKDKKDDGHTLLVTKEEIQKKVFDVLEANKFIWSSGMPLIQYYMLMKFHSEHNMRNDCASLHWITQQNWRGIGVEQRWSKNWLIGKSKGRGVYDWKIQLNDYKTKKPTDGAFEVECSKALSKLINHYLQNHWKKHYAADTNHYSDFMMSPVFVKGKNEEHMLEPITSNDMTQILQKYNQIYLGKKIGTKMLRHSFYTEKYSDIGKELQVDAQNSLHSVSTAINHYTHLTTEEQEAIQPLLELNNEVPEL